MEDKCTYMHDWCMEQILKNPTLKWIKDKNIQNTKRIIMKTINKLNIVSTNKNMNRNFCFGTDLWATEQNTFTVTNQIIGLKKNWFSITRNPDSGTLENPKPGQFQYMTYKGLQVLHKYLHLYTRDHISLDSESLMNTYASVH